MTTDTTTETRARHSLRRNTLSIAGSVAMCMAFMGPATSVAFNTPQAAAGAGAAAAGAAVTFLLGLKLGPLGVYGFARTILGLGMIVIYILISLAVIRFYRREHRSEFRWIRLGVLPALTAILMLLRVWGQIHPAPAWPNNLVPYLIAAWMVIGAGYLVFLRTRRPALVSAMGRVFESDTDSDEKEAVS